MAILYSVNTKHRQQALQLVTSDQLFQSAYLSFQRGQHDAAVNYCQTLLGNDPRHINGLQLLAHLRFAANGFAEAIELLGRAATIDPDNAVIWANLGAASCAAGRFAEAIEPLQNALRLNPSHVDAWRNLGRALRSTARLVEAEIAYQNAVALKPGDADTLHELSGVCSELGHVDAAIAALQKVVELRPQFPEALNNLAALQQEIGELGESIRLYRESLSARDDLRVHANLIMALHLVDDDLAAATREIAKWNALYVAPIQRGAQRIQESGTQTRRLRVGYVSRDFNLSPVGRFIKPILKHHDRKAFEIFAYADSDSDDRIARQIKSSVDHWQPTLALSDDQLAQSIRDDQIDVLIDLGMHTKSSRLLVFARKPAPVQLSYLAYAGMTGLTAIDGTISDGYLDPSGVANVRSFWCYEAPEEAPAVDHRAGGITFGCLNNFAKITPAVRVAWMEIFRRLPDARLVVHSPAGSHRQGFPIAPNRVTFVDRLPPAEYFAMYNSIDIVLDTFPYPGGTTTCDALWMATPVVSVAGNTTISRAGLSILSNAGFPELVASDRSAYVELAVTLALDRGRLNDLHQTLRHRMQQSPLMDANRAARDLEAAFRRLWQRFSTLRPR